MKFSEIKKITKEHQSAIKFDNFLTSQKRFLITKFLLLFLFLIFGFILYKSGFLKDSFLKVLNKDFNFSWILIKNFVFKNIWLLKISILIFVLYLILKMFRAFLFSKMFDKSILDFELLTLIYFSEKENDIVRALFKTRFGKELKERLFIPDEDLKKFLAEKKEFKFDDEENIYFNKSEIQRIEYKVTIVDFLDILFERDLDFKKFLLRQGIKKDDFIGAAGWIYRKQFNYKNNRRWWSRERLLAFGQFGTAMSYGRLYFLDKFSWDISYYKGLFGKNAYEVYQNDIKKMENIYLKGNNQNLFLVSESETVSFEILKLLSYRLSLGDLGSEYESMRIKVIPSTLFFEQNKNNFEEILIAILNEAANAGNITIVFQDFFNFYSQAQRLGVDILAIMKHYFNSEIVFIILAKKSIYENFLQNNSYLKDYFETVVAYHNFDEGFLFLMQESILKMERRNRFMVSFKAMKYLVNSARKYFSDKSLPETFMELLKDFVIYSKRNGAKMLNLEMAKNFIEFKTGIPQSIETNKNKIIQLEQNIKKKIIGQDEAVQSIANAIKRSRAGLDDKNKPIASFLFVGPTGVGKTETAKVLADEYFGDRKKMIRFDMSEYSTPEAVAELIGSTYTNKIGSLSKFVNTNPYALFLFDELEKANREVHDLFLQILDEGVITDAFGTKLDFRNSIIIATSNAGSSLMYQKEYDNLDGEERKAILMKYIIDNHIFRPEFLNRFSKIIFFNKLNLENMKKIVGLQLKYLVDKLLNQSYEFVVTDELKEYLANKAGATNFGARETKRVIKEELESFIADKIIEGEIKVGDRFKIIPTGNGLKIEILE